MKKETKRIIRIASVIFCFIAMISCGDKLATPTISSYNWTDVEGNNYNLVITDEARKAISGTYTLSITFSTGGTAVSSGAVSGTLSNLTLTPNTGSVITINININENSIIISGDIDGNALNGGIIYLNDNVPKSIRITGIVNPENTKMEAHIDVNAGDFTNPDGQGTVAMGTSNIVNQTLTVELINAPNNRLAEGRWTGIGEWCVRLKFWDIDTDLQRDYIWKDWEKIDIKNAVTELKFSDFVLAWWEEDELDEPKSVRITGINNSNRHKSILESKIKVLDLGNIKSPAVVTIMSDEEGAPFNGTVAIGEGEITSNGELFVELFKWSEETGTTNVPWTDYGSWIIRIQFEDNDGYGHDLFGNWREFYYIKSAVTNLSFSSFELVHINTPEGENHFWNRAYHGHHPVNIVISGGNTLTINNLDELVELIGKGSSFAIEIIDGGKLKENDANGAVVGKYDYIKFDGSNKGILIYRSNDSYYNLGLGTKTSPPDGVFDFVNGISEGGIYFDPPVSYEGISTDYYWAGGD